MSTASLRVVVTGFHWMGRGIGSIDTALEELLLSVRDELTIVAYSITSGADSVLDDVETAARNGHLVTIVINRLSDQGVEARRRLLSLEQAYGNLYLYEFAPSDSEYDLHAKTVIVDRKRALVGSSNLSLRGLEKNHELGVLIEGEAVVEVASAVDALIRSGGVRPIGN